jgi:hypothetical protein
VSQTVESPRPIAADAEMPSRSRGRVLIVIMLLVTFVVSVLLRDLARNTRQAATTARNPASSSGTTLASMNSFTLGLMLGGLRGPLVMMLWTSSETQKQDKNLEDFDTKVELIRLLQPEFDSVLLFQIWNKAYNISVQMSSLYNKYITILDAIDYGKDALADRPDNINVISAVADVYFNKLGNSAEKHYYRAQVRKESLPHKSKARDDKKDPGWRRTQLDQIVDAKGVIDPALVTPRRQRPAGGEANQAFNDGSELQYLKKFEPYPYGVSPVALGYNYFMQAQTLQRVSHARHAQTSEMVVDSRPAIALKFWVEEEQELGRRHELAAFGKPLPANAGIERIELEMPLAVLPLDQTPANPAKLTEAIYNYERSASLVDEGVNEYREHLKRHPTGLEMYRSHIDGLTAVKRFALADAAYLKAMQASGEERTKWKKVAKEEYEQTIVTYVRIMLRYYTDEPFFRAALPNVSREQIDSLTLEQLMGATAAINRMIERGAPESHMEDRREYTAYITRCIERLKELEK